MDFTGASRRLGTSAGVLHMLAATFWFALMNVTIKLLAHLPAMELVFFRCGVATIIGIVSLKQLNINLRGTHNRLLLLRGTFGTIALFTFFLTMQQMPMGTAVTIQYMSPIFSALIAAVLMKENIRPVQWLFFLMAFAGVLLIKGFDSSVSWTKLGIGIFSSFFSALAYNMVRSLRDKEHPLVVVLHFQFIGFITGGIFTSFNWVAPVGYEWLLILLTGVFTQLGQINLTKSLQKENINRVSILNYLGVFYALFLGWFIFGEKAGPGVVAGILLVAGGVVLNMWTTSKKVNDSL